MSARFAHRIRVRYQECDPQGVVYFARYLDYFDVALTELWRERFGAYNTLVESGSDLVVAEVNVRYRAAAAFDDVIEVMLDGVELGNTSMTMRWRIVLEDRLLAEATFRQVFIQAGTRDKKAIPDDVRAGLVDLASQPSAA
jgi:acyl-CoA thioester hydrolase